MLRPAPRGTELAARPKPFGVRSLTTERQRPCAGMPRPRKSTKRGINFGACDCGTVPQRQRPAIQQTGKTPRVGKGPTRGLLRPLRGSGFALGQPDAFGAGAFLLRLKLCALQPLQLRKNGADCFNTEARRHKDTERFITAFGRGGLEDASSSCKNAEMRHAAGLDARSEPEW